MSSYNNTQNTYVGLGNAGNAKTKPIAGNNDSAFGYASNYSVTDGSANTAIGSYALVNNAYGNYNTAIGVAALGKLKPIYSESLPDPSGKIQPGSANSALGCIAGQNDILGSCNTYLGAQSGQLGTDSTNYVQCTAIGYRSNLIPDIKYATYFDQSYNITPDGSQKKGYTGLSNQIVIGTTGAKVLIPGDLFVLGSNNFGAQGATGYTGAQGKEGKGVTGYTGAQGAKGFTGAQGNDGKGVTGAQGNDGKGVTGAQGAQGYTGSSGSFSDDIVCNTLSANDTITAKNDITTNRNINATSGSVISKNMAASGYITAGNVTPGDAGTITALNNITSTAGSLSSINMAATGYITAGNVTPGDAGSISAAGNIYANDGEIHTYKFTGNNMQLNDGITAGGAIISINSYITAGNYISATNSITSTNGDIYALNGTVQSKYMEAASFTSTSDYRIKDQIISIKDHDPELTVDKLNPVIYVNSKTNKKDMGFIAHEIQEVYPFLVSGEKDGKENQTVNYIGLIALLVKEIQELKMVLKSKHLL